MAYFSTELAELAIITAILFTLLLHFRKDVFHDLNLFLVASGLALAIIGLIFHYIMSTPLRPEFEALVGEIPARFSSVVFYAPASVNIIWGLKRWFVGVIDNRAEIRRRRNAEQLLAETNELIAQVLDSSHQGILLIDSEYKVQLTNGRFHELLEVPVNLGSVGTTYRQLINHLVKNGEYSSEDTDTVYQEWVQLLKDTPYLHFQRTRPNGTILDIEARWIDGSGLLATYTDVTKQAIAEMELMKNREMFRDFTETASDWMWEMDQKMTISYVSELGMQLSGRPPEEVIGYPFEKLSDVFEGTENWYTLIEDPDNYESFKDLHTVYILPDGTRRHFSVSGKPIFNHSEEFVGYRGVGRDITSRKQVEEQLQQAQKMEAIGRLTGGIAHDFNNLLAVLLGNTELMRDVLPENSENLVPLLDNLERATMRGAELTQQLLSYSRKQRLQPTNVDLREGLSGIVSLIGRSLGEDIDITVRHPEGLWPAHTDPGQLENAILNLANNARDAMPSGGSLLIETHNHIQGSGDHEHDCCDFPAGNYVSVSVTDTGEGIESDILEKIFEPFFTTKEIGKGTGLGLSMVFGFAKQSNGHVCIDSKPGNGTCVTLFLPRAVLQKRLSA